MSSPTIPTERIVRHFRQILLWPLKLMPIQEDLPIQKHWELLDQADSNNPWRELSFEFNGVGTRFQKRHYNETVWRFRTRKRYGILSVAFVRPLRFFCVLLTATGFMTYPTRLRRRSCFVCARIT